MKSGEIDLSKLKPSSTKDAKAYEIEQRYRNSIKRARGNAGGSR